VLRSKLIYFAGKMQRIPKEDQAVHIVDAGSSNLGGDSPSQRMPMIPNPIAPR
jgi:hypothetical protein